MRLLVVILFSVAVLTVECGKHSRKHKDVEEQAPDDGEADGGEVEDWPHPDTVSNFGIPDMFVEGSGSFSGSFATNNESKVAASKQHSKAKKHGGH